MCIGTCKINLYEKSPPAFIMASTQYLNCFQTLATVALGRMAVTSMLLSISEVRCCGGLC
jgi:hypothetical protein